MTFPITRTLLATGLYLASFAALAPLSLAEGAHHITFSPESKIWLDGDSTLHKYHSAARQFQVAGTLSSTKPDARVTGLSVVVPVRGLKSGEGGLDDNMYKALKADRFPTIRFTETGATVHLGANGAVSVDATGRLAIAGTERSVTVHADGRLNGSTLHLAGTKAIKMSEFGIQPPVLLAGAIKCSDKIVVGYDLVGRLSD